MLPRLPKPPLRNKGRWIVDDDGLVVIVHGVNMINKIPPEYSPKAAGFMEEDARLLAANGLNVVRVGVIYSAVEPEPRVYDDAYLASIRETVEMLAGYGIMSLIDFHQDGWGPEFSCEGFPKWATMTNGNVFPGGPFPGLLNDRAVKAAFDNLWSNTPPGPDLIGLQDLFAAAWAHAVQQLKDAPGIIGWEILNEPWPASLIEHVDEAHQALRAFTQKVVQAIRTQDQDHMIWYEPWVLFDWGIPTGIGKIEDTIDPPRIGFAFHNYIPYPQAIPIREVYDLGWNNAIDHSNATGAALLATEFGADISTADAPAAAAIQAQMNSIDGKMLPAIYWAYWNRTPYEIVNPITKHVIPVPPMGIVDDLHIPRVTPNLNDASLLALTRPYPMFIAGTPQSWNFDPETRVFNLSYAPDLTLGSNVTEIFVPDLQYPNGFNVSISPAGSVETSTGPQALLVTALQSPESVSVSISPT
jgi:endoglycosylceramidase